MHGFGQPLWALWIGALRGEVSQLLQGIDYTFARAEDVSFSAKNLAGFHLSEGMLYALVLLLVAEQIAAYAASYHPRRLAGAR